MPTSGGIPSDLENVWIYLRKSREDREAEERARTEGSHEIETLSRHRRTLLELAQMHNHIITQILEEVVSGEFISERPEMNRLLHAVENEDVTAVWVMDLDRLGRGDMADQGMILRTFKDSGTLILTPDKVYDLGDEMDEEWTEFKTFFARRELKMISKRMQRGRVAAVKEGKFIGSRPPFGYDVTKDLILVPNDDAHIVKRMFDLYVNHNSGCNRIAHYLNTLGIETPLHKAWRGESVLAILKNNVYAGWITWRKVKHDKRRRTYRQRPKEQWIIAKGQHEPLIDEFTFDLATQIRKSRNHTPIKQNHKMSNPLAGLIECGKCGELLVKRPYTKQAPHLICKNPNCTQKSTRLSIVEEKLIEALSTWFAQYKLDEAELTKIIQPNQPSLLINARLLHSIEEKMIQIEGQRDNLHNLLERGVYDTDTYSTRMMKLQQNLEYLQKHHEVVEYDTLRANELQEVELSSVSSIPQLMSVYRNTKDVAKRNELLKSVLKKVVYNKEKWQRCDEFALSLFLLV